jgi:GNAT superfamily N-acetyltransferase
MSRVEVRQATVHDAVGMALVHVRSWRAAYAGIMPAVVLDTLDPAAWAERNRRYLADPNPSSTTFVALDAETRVVVGFAYVGPYHVDEDTGEVDDDTGELYAIYTQPDRWGTGAGRALMAAALTQLTAERPRPVRLWVLEANHRARRFYERCGFVLDGSTGFFALDVPGGTAVRLGKVRYYRPAIG